MPSPHTSGAGRSKRPSRRPLHLVEACGLGWLRVDRSPLSSSAVCQRHAHTLTSRHMESYLNILQPRLNEWRIAINVSKSTAIIFVRAGMRFIQPRPVTLFGEPIQCVDTTRYLGGDPRYTTQLVTAHRSVQKENCSKDGYVGSPPD